MNFTPAEELLRRQGRLQERIGLEFLDGALLTENMDLFYFTGSMQQGFLFIPDEGNSLYMVRRNFARALDESGLEIIRPLRDMKQLQAYINDFRGKKKLKRIGLELDVLPVKSFRRLEEMFSGVEFVDISGIIKEIRMVKSEYEINFFRKANEIACRIFEQIPGFLQVGKPEAAVSAEIEALYRKAGHQGLVRMRTFNMEIFFCHVFSGENGTMSSFLDSCTAGRGISPASPQAAGWKALAPHEPIGIDYTSIYEGYILDHTRIFSIGALSAELERAYRLAVSIQNEIVARARPGLACKDLYRLAVEMAAGEGLDDYFMGYGEGQVKFIAHGIGLNLDEFPVFSQGTPHLLQPGMVFALEPKFIFPGKGMVGLENVWLVTDSGLERLTTMPDDLVTIDY
ncbi:MAG: aminopeptidase P family protein [Firmicutes bacterium]|nr:aminopeptidase P family protein [Bacillota bacterium]